jgi:hypothetical protein
MPGIRSDINELIAARLDRREVLKGAAAASAFGLFGGAGEAGAQVLREPARAPLGFTEVPHALEQGTRVVPGYTAQVVVRWGDKVMPGAPDFDPRAQTAAAQLRQFGYDNDYLAFMPLPYGSNSSERGLLCSNHERTSTPLMFPGVTPANVGQLTREQCEVQMASQGHAVVEIRREGRNWRVVADSPFNRRYNALDSLMRIGGPAAGHPRMRTSADPTGTRVIGTFNNCAGGETPWGTILTCEENFHNYFTGNPRQGGEAAARERYGVTGRGTYVWGRYHDRFNLDREPNEPNRFGWVVEIDPYDPSWTPVKRTAIGRCKHEGATCALTADGRVAVYTGDDERFEYVYKFVSRGRYNPRDRAANRNLLDDGTLYAARFDANGAMRWLPLVFGRGPLTRANGFNSQADVVIEARRAADLVGATPMDRPEDIEPHPTTGRVYVVLTYNEQRRPANDPDARRRANPANPRPNNLGGHIIEMIHPTVNGRVDHGAEQARWEFFMLAGDPAKTAEGARYLNPTSANGWVGRPDNVAFDAKGRIWISTDGQDDYGNVSDSLYAAEVAGPARGATRLFFNGPRGSEICGPCFTPDNKTLFLAIQHPAEERNSTFDSPTTRWPDNQDTMPPRPSVIAITKDDGGDIGS